MDANTVLTLINAVGFPIFCVLGLGMYIWKREQADREDRKSINEMLTTFSLNIQANTEALKNLSSLINNNSYSISYEANNN